MKWLLAAGLIGYVLNICIRLKYGGDTYSKLWHYATTQTEDDIRPWLKEDVPSPFSLTWIVLSMGLCFLAGLGIYEMGREKSPVLSLFFLLLDVLSLLYCGVEESIHLVAKNSYCRVKGGEDAYQSFLQAQYWGGNIWLCKEILRGLTSIPYILLILRKALPLPWPFLFVNPLFILLVLYRSSIKCRGDIGMALSLLLMLVVL